MVEDVNDNSPDFEQKDYYFKAASNQKGTLLGVAKVKNCTAAEFSCIDSRITFHI